ncbi:type II toxin-antitoxin system RelE/ParE family toxin [bacterium]|nr:type II toxin-antitoxin system RelE/ParE family toxin [bacterium]
MNYTVTLSSRATRDRCRLPLDVRRRVDSVLLSLEKEPRPPGCLKMKGSDEWRIRVGVYRIRYLIDDDNQTVTVTRICHRRDVYDS